MRLSILLPNKVLYDGQVSSVSFETVQGQYTLLPGHIDFTASLTPGIGEFIEDESGTKAAAVNGGTIVKKGDRISIATPQAAIGDHIKHLEDILARQFEDTRDRKKRIRGAMARIEADFVKIASELKG